MQVRQIFLSGSQTATTATVGAVGALLGDLCADDIDCAMLPGAYCSRGGCFCRPGYLPTMHRKGCVGKRHIQSQIIKENCFLKATPFRIQYDYFIYSYFICLITSQLEFRYKLYTDIKLFFIGMAFCEVIKCFLCNRAIS